ncbi:MAG: acetylxylan esterase [Clostridia bacterium]|nr:acetylxylan esterase [Clostridia bacterium]
MLSALLEERALPPLRAREELLEILQREIYGRMPAAPESEEFTVETKVIWRFCAGKAVCDRVTARCVVNGRPFTFPFLVTVPTAPGPHPFFIHLNFRQDNPDRYMPTEELIDAGFAVLSVCYEDVSSDNDDFTDGLAGLLFDGGVRGPEDPGKIALWAWSAHRILDYAQTRADQLDLRRAAVCGHSRLGKTALLAAATDTRFAFAYSNDSGCSGAALARGTTGETVRDICERFPFWFCENYKQYVDNEAAMPFDQHFLLAAIAPRCALVGSAAADDWADPVSEFLCCCAAAPAFPGGFPCPDRLPGEDEAILDGRIGYHCRPGLHYFSRTDWQRLIEFIRRHS